MWNKSLPDIIRFYYTQIKRESICVHTTGKDSSASYGFSSLPSFFITTDFKPPGHLLGVLWFCSSIGISAAYAVYKHRVCCVWGCFHSSFSYSFVTLLGVASVHGLACFPLLTMMSLFPADQPLSRTWSMVTQMAWETAKVSRPFSLLSFLLFSTPTTIATIPLFTVNSVPLFSRPSISFFAAVTFLCPVCSSLTILSFSLFHPSVPFGSHPLVSFSLLILWSPGQWSVVSTWAKTGLLLVKPCENTAQTFSDTQGRCFYSWAVSWPI